jgi:aryl-alcohol dehydrogenase-like predicted oxidoreductase
MELRPLGAGNLRVSPISLGAMSFGSGFTRETVIDDDLAAALVNRAIDAGVNLIDTADTYGGTFGTSETVLGRVLRNRRDEVLLATKVGYGDLGPNVLTYDNVIAGCEGSLRRLGIETIDLYQLHRPDRSVPLEETLGALEDLVTRGLVREFGVSNYRAFEVAGAVARLRALQRPCISSVQVQYSLVSRDVEHEILPHCRTDDIGVLVFQPLAGGQLTGWRDTRGARGRRRLGILDTAGPENLPRARAVVDAIARARGVSMAQVALAWVLAQPGITSAIVGASILSQLDDALLATDLVLEAEELLDLDAATALTPIYPASSDRGMGFLEPGDVSLPSTGRSPDDAPWLARNVANVAAPPGPPSGRSDAPAPTQPRREAET